MELHYVSAIAQPKVDAGGAEEAQRGSPSQVLRGVKGVDFAIAAGIDAWVIKIAFCETKHAKIAEKGLRNFLRIVERGTH